MPLKNSKIECRWPLNKVCICTFSGFRSDCRANSKSPKRRKIAHSVESKAILLQCVFWNCWLCFLFERASLDMFFIIFWHFRRFRCFRRIVLAQFSFLTSCIVYFFLFSSYAPPNEYLTKKKKKIAIIR